MDSAAVYQRTDSRSPSSSSSNILMRSLGEELGWWNVMRSFPSTPLKTMPCPPSFPNSISSFVHGPAILPDSDERTSTQ